VIHFDFIRGEVMGGLVGSFHDLRGQLGTIRLSATLLEHEPELTEIGQTAVHRISVALKRVEEQIEILERTTQVSAAQCAAAFEDASRSAGPLFRDPRRAESSRRDHRVRG
jgi:hypothetical protein